MRAREKRMARRILRRCYWNAYLVRGDGNGTQGVSSSSSTVADSSEGKSDKVEGELPLSDAVDTMVDTSGSASVSAGRGTPNFLRSLKGRLRKPQCRAHIEFFKNGVSQGVAYTFTPDSSIQKSSAAACDDADRQRLEETKKLMTTMPSAAKFYPAASMFGRAKVRFNAGPNFSFSIPDGARPMSERA